MYNKEWVKAEYFLSAQEAPTWKQRQKQSRQMFLLLKRDNFIQHPRQTVGLGWVIWLKNMSRYNRITLVDLDKSWLV